MDKDEETIIAAIVEEFRDIREHYKSDPKIVAGAEIMYTVFQEKLSMILDLPIIADIEP